MAKRKEVEQTAEADMTPMIDMTFQLIAFFMVLINFAEDNMDDRVKLPSSELAKVPKGRSLRPSCCKCRALVRFCSVATSC